MAAVVFFITASLVLVYVFLPMTRERRSWLDTPGPGDEAARELEREKESYLRALKDVDFEYASEKINGDDYARLRDHYRLKLARVLAALEPGGRGREGGDG